MHPVKQVYSMYLTRVDEYHSTPQEKFKREKMKSKQKKTEWESKLKL